MSELRKPHVFKHGGDGNWRSRMQDAKGHWRTFKFETGKHQPGINGEPPPTTASGAFVTIPKAIRETVAPQTEPEPQKAQAEPAQPGEVAQSPAPQPPQAEPPQTEEPKQTSGFPAFCADATRSGSVSVVEQADPAQPGAIGVPDAPKPPSRVEVPVVELLIDTMFQMGEELGGPKAPKGSATEGLSLETLREKMVESGREIFPAGNVEAGPKTTFFGSVALYFYMCYSQEQFRENTAPWYVKAKAKFAGWWTKFRHNRRRRKAEQPAQTEKKEGENNA